jgi:hypothetical protein
MAEIRRTTQCVVDQVGQRALDELRVTVGFQPVGGVR